MSETQITGRIVFHGSECSIDEFEEREAGIFFAETRNVALAYAAGRHGEIGDGHVVAARLTMRTPLMIDAAFLNQFAKDFAKQVEEAALLAGIAGNSLTLQESFEDSETWARDLVLAHAKSHGHDGVILEKDLLPDEHLGGDWSLQRSYVVFSPSSIEIVPDPLVESQMEITPLGLT